ncbi:MAG: helix-turn-helix transcriptional regulator [Actinomycetota bacterium]|nr:helix-turn-helix transcriptional regulator [Actinomycetota bacterium]
MGLGARIKQLRKEAGWSQAELGEKIGTDSQRVSRYENERIAPNIDGIVRIAEAFNVSIDHLLVDGIPRRPLHSAEHNLGDHLANIGELSESDLEALTNVVDGLVAKNRLKILAGGLS